jgi:hypothetical protein
MSSQAFGGFEENRADVERLWEIHEEVGGDGVGARHNVQVLNKAAIVFTTAAWEAYIEDVATEAFDFLLVNAPSATTFPAAVRVLAAKEIRESSDQRRVWELADTGWRGVLIDHRGAVLKNWIKFFNTPKTDPVDALFSELIGLRSIHQHWVWQNMTAEQAKEKLDRYIVVRGEIAHRVQHAESVRKSWSTDFLSHVQRLVEKTDAEVATFIDQTVGQRPW